MENNDKPKNPQRDFNFEARTMLGKIHRMGQFIENKLPAGSMTKEYGATIQKECNDLVTLVDEWKKFMANSPTSITLLDLYAKDAPTEIPEWFEYKKSGGNGQDAKKWDKEQKEERYFAWRFYYATAMLKERAKHV